MILDPASIRASVTLEARVSVFGRARTRHLSDSGGLRQFGVHDQVLEPGASSSRRHWHSAEDEFALVLEGVVTLHDDAGRHEMRAGDAVAWPQGCPNAHRLVNDSDAECRYLIVGSRAFGDVCTYPDDGRVQINHASQWEIRASDGTILREGALAEELLDLRQPWGRDWDGLRRASVIRSGAVPGEYVPSSAPAPYDALGDYRAHPLSDAGGLSQFGAFTETLMPGARSSHRHWHSDEDELLYTLDGVVCLPENDGAHDLPPGSCACWPAGVPNAHCLENRTDRPVTYFVVGSRLPEDEVSYPDIDLHYVRRNGLRSLLHKDGTFYPGWPQEVNR